jgi:chlorobactene glucosyltransferase
MISTALLTVMVFLLVIALANVLFWPKPRPARPLFAEQVSVLIPARNEEANLSACLEAVLQQGESVREVLVYNDHSTDGTGRILREFAERDKRVRPVEVLPLAEGWCGKNFACAQLAKAATGKFLLFIDADAQLTPGAAARMVEEMSARRLSFLSCWPGLKLISFWEQALMPMLNFVVFATFPSPLSLLLNSPSLGLAHGACLMFERATYEQVGGHAAVRDQIFEDTRLARLWRERGQRGLCLDGQDVVRVRMYSSFAEIWQGFQKNFFPAFKRESSFWFFTAFHAVVFLAPFVWLMVSPSLPLLLAALTIFLIRLVLAWRFRHPLWAALLHPLAEAILLVLGLSSWRRCKSGRGVAWKGREYHKTAKV